MELRKTGPLRGEINIPGDKSISHRAILIGSIASGKTKVTNFLQGADCLATIDCMRSCGVQIESLEDEIIVHGRGLRGLQGPSTSLYVGNSGTTTRLISGILAGQSFTSILSGDESLNKRPMKRIIEPLSRMGAKIESMHNDGCAPLQISSGALTGISYHSPIASAQVKSAILLAGLYANGETKVSEPILSRNHTELMLAGFGASLKNRITEEGFVEASITPAENLIGQSISIPGDISSAAYWIAAALLVPGSELLLKNVSMNPSRDGFLKVVHAMGGNLSYSNQRLLGKEPVADILVKESALSGTTIEGAIIPTLIDEIPIIAVLAAFAKGTTTIRDAAELKVKETDRIRTITENLLAMGGEIEPTEDGMVIQGGKPLHGAEIKSYYDHRIAMAFSIAALQADGTTTIKDADCVLVSYPSFYEMLPLLTLS